MLSRLAGVQDTSLCHSSRFKARAPRQTRHAWLATCAVDCTELYTCTTFQDSRAHQEGKDTPESSAHTQELNLQVPEPLQTRNPAPERPIHGTSWNPSCRLSFQEMASHRVDASDQKLLKPCVRCCHALLALLASVVPLTSYFLECFASGVLFLGPGAKLVCVCVRAHVYMWSDFQLVAESSFCAVLFPSSRFLVSCFAVPHGEEPLPYES